MRYRLMMLCALVSCGLGCSATHAKPALSLELLEVGGWRVVRSIDVVATGFQLGHGVIRKEQGRVPADFQPPAFRHNAASDQVLLADWGIATWDKARSQLWMWFTNGMEHTPALVMVLFLLLVVPPLAVTGWFFRWLQPDPNVTRRLVGGGREFGELQSDESMSGRAMAYSRDAVLEIEGSGSGASLGSYPLSRDELVVRIGREDDNEIQIRDRTVHRYHAAIDRSMDGGIAISDLSSNRGNGVVVNGERVSRVQLKDGDRIGLGAVSLTFRVNAQ